MQLKVCAIESARSAHHRCYGASVCFRKGLLSGSCVNLWFESNNTSLNLPTHLLVSTTSSVYSWLLWLLYCYPVMSLSLGMSSVSRWLCSLVCLTSSRLVISVMYAVHFTQSILYNCYVYCTLYNIYYSCTTMIDQLHCITLHISSLPLHCCIQRRERKESL